MQRKLTMVMSVAALLAAVVVVPALTGCGGKKEEAASSTSTESAPAATPATGGDAASTTTAIPAGDAAKGKEIFTAKCVLCHGANGMGDGPGGAALNPKPRNFHDTAYMSTKTDAELFNSIKNGKSNVMPAWGQAGMTDQECADALAYVRTFGK